MNQQWSLHQIFSIEPKKIEFAFIITFLTAYLDIIFKLSDINGRQRRDVQQCE